MSNTLTTCFVRFFVPQISPELLNGFAPNLPEDVRVWSVARTSLNVKVTRDKNDIFRPIRQPACSLCLMVKHQV